LFSLGKKHGKKQDTVRTILQYAVRRCISTEVNCTQKNHSAVPIRRGPQELRFVRRGSRGKLSTGKSCARTCQPTARNREHSRHHHRHAPRRRLSEAPREFMWSSRRSGSLFGVVCAESKPLKWHSLVSAFLSLKRAYAALMSPTRSRPNRSEPEGAAGMGMLLSDGASIN
jgi:hypothetical protein